MAQHHSDGHNDLEDVEGLEAPEGPDGEDSDDVMMVMMVMMNDNEGGAGTASDVVIRSVPSSRSKRVGEMDFWECIYLSL